MGAEGGVDFLRPRRAEAVQCLHLLKRIAIERVLMVLDASVLQLYQDHQSSRVVRLAQLQAWYGALWPRLNEFGGEGSNHTLELVILSLPPFDSAFLRLL